jgi:hypothetical protein
MKIIHASAIEMLETEPSAVFGEKVDNLSEGTPT